MSTKIKRESILFVCVISLIMVVYAIQVQAQERTKEELAKPTVTKEQLKIDEKAEDALKIEQEKEAVEKAKQEEVEKIQQETLITKLNLPEDAGPSFTVKNLFISGNTLVSTHDLLGNVPPVYNASDVSIFEAPSQMLFDLREIQAVIRQPGIDREVSARAIQGLTQYILSVYQQKGYGGVYVYVPSGAVEKGQKLRDNVLPIRIMEATVSKVSVTHYNPDNEEVEVGYLKDDAVMDWSPAVLGGKVNRKKLDGFVNLLNLNPDRYVSAVVSRGVEPNSLAIGYNIYEANPWHWFLQLDNAGTDDKEWAPRLGLINTNLFGFDDTFTAMYQAPWSKEIDEEYSLYGSYDFPLLGPWLRLTLYGGYSQFDISGMGGIDFLGDGSFYGGILRYNVLQWNDWFFDVTGSMSHEESKVTPSLFPGFLGTDIKIDLWGWGIDIHHRDDMSDTSFTYDRTDSYGGSSGSEFTLARTMANPDFTIQTAAASHSQYLDPNKINRMSGLIRFVTSDERLVPAKMTTFGGMYSVRGYDEYEVVADGGILASVQYEYDVIAQQKADRSSINGMEENDKNGIRKLAPLFFWDYGLARIEDPQTGEHKDQELCSIGGGVIMDVGDYFTGTLYYGYPMIATDNTREGKGRMNVGFLLRW